MPQSPAISSDRLALETARQTISRLERRLASEVASARESREREARFRILSELVADSCWVRWRSADGSEERGWINEAFHSLTGYSPAEFEAVGREGLVHPDDLEKIQAYIDGPPGRSEHEFRIVRKDGAVRWLHERMQVVEEADGSLSVYGATRDVTDEKRARQVLLDARRDLEETIAERTRELVRVNQRLEREIEERRQMAADLQRAKDAAEASNQAKSRFLATVTHELRTPLHGIVGFADLLLDSDVGAEARQWIEMLERSATSLQALVEEVLDFSKIEAGQLVLDPHAFALGSLVHELMETFEERAARRGNSLVVSLDPGLPVLVEGDSVRLRQVLLNLVDNAIKFTRDGVVRLEVIAPRDARRDGEIVFDVTDTGIGFEPEQKHQLFDPFSQADASTTRVYGGTGLGLAISRSLVTLMGGRLEAESTPGEGSRFHFAIPLPAATRARDEAEPVEAVTSGRGRRILVAEDNEINQLVIREFLEGLGYEVDLAADGAAALTALEATRYDACLLDCAMPKLDGFEVARRWRCHEQRRGDDGDERMPIVAVTATAVRETIDDCLAAGMDDVLTKPFRHAALTATLERWLEKEAGSE